MCAQPGQQLQILELFQGLQVCHLQTLQVYLFLQIVSFLEVLVLLAPGVRSQLLINITA